MYAPGVGRFTARDPIGYRGGIGLYVYVLNAPNRFSDPFGLSTDTRTIYVYKGDAKEHLMSESWEKYIAEDANGCCFEVGLDVSYTRVSRYVEAWEITFDTNLWGEISVGLGIASGAAGVTAGVLALAPEPGGTKVGAAVAGISAGVLGIGAAVTGIFADEDEIGSELKDTGHFWGFKNFKANSYYKIGAIECPYSWDIDFDIDENGELNLPASFLDAYPDTLSTPSNPGYHEPYPNDWDDWSDQSQVVVNGS
jgi:uncharacterized protein RhaS with RHS repeats